MTCGVTRKWLNHRVRHPSTAVFRMFSAIEPAGIPNAAHSIGRIQCICAAREIQEFQLTTRPTGQVEGRSRGCQHPTARFGVTQRENSEHGRRDASSSSLYGRKFRQECKWMIKESLAQMISDRDWKKGEWHSDLALALSPSVSVENRLRASLPTRALIPAKSALGACQKSPPLAYAADEPALLRSGRLLIATLHAARLDRPAPIRARVPPM
ncbi:hypothetical protein DFH07DRAFT_780322 [Mycena maculata]|uniref:Uncharacterized protein n=1 Tax=Mycena maculata TaxID=230809 RepID=A0AAD7I4J5_9AGAR|nr:hypothetical protein DFH07DRAFT_780322 [Mycena maculata]